MSSGCYGLSVERSLIRYSASIQEDSERTFTQDDFDAVAIVNSSKSYDDEDDFSIPIPHPCPSKTVARGPRMPHPVYERLWRESFDDEFSRDHQRIPAPAPRPSNTRGPRCLDPVSLAMRVNGMDEVPAPYPHASNTDAPSARVLEPTYRQVWQDDRDAPGPYEAARPSVRARRPSNVVASRPRPENPYSQHIHDDEGDLGMMERLRLDDRPDM